MRDRLTRARRTVAAGVVLSALASAAVLHSTGTAAHAVVARQHLAIPSYFWPGASWDAVIAHAGAIDIAVVNVDSGPGTARVTTFATTVAAARLRGIRVVGYVHTGYSARPLAEVLTDIDRYYAWYGVDGVFVDEVPSDCAQGSYYGSVADRIRTHGEHLVVVNPGTNPEECAAGFSDVIVNFEGTAGEYQTWSPASWTGGYPADRFWHLIYGADATDVSSLVSLSGERNAAHVYVTDDAMPNPWDALPGPSAWSSLLGAVSGRSAAPNAIPLDPGAPRGAAPSAMAPSTVAPVGNPPEGPAVPGPAPSSLPPPAATLPAATLPATTLPPDPTPTAAADPPSIPAGLTTAWAASTAVVFTVVVRSEPGAPVAAPLREPPLLRVATVAEPVQVAQVPKSDVARASRAPALARLLSPSAAPRPLAVTARPVPPAPCPRPGQRAAACAPTGAAIH